MSRTLGALLCGLLVVACNATASSPAAEGSASETAAVSSEASAPSQSPAPTPVEQSPSPMVAPDSIADVVTTDLVMRSLPGVTDESIIFERVLQPGDRVFVLDGPEHATFYDWYLVEPLGDHYERLPAGWVAAAGRDGEPWIAPATLDCPSADPADAFQLESFHAYELLSCFGDRPIQVTVQAMGICSGVVPGPPNYVIEPAWLGMSSTCGWGRESEYLATMQPYLEPSVGTGFPPGADRLDQYVLTGQFDHPEAANCVLRELPDGSPHMPPVPDLTAEQVVLGCRSHFAVQRAELVGG